MRLVDLSHFGPARSEGQACAAFIHAGGFLGQDWAVLAHRDGWGVPTTLDRELMARVQAARATGIQVVCRLERDSSHGPPQPPHYTLIGDAGERIRFLGPAPSEDDLGAVQRIRAMNDLLRIIRTSPDHHFRTDALKRFSRLGLWEVPDLRARSTDGSLGAVGSWVHTVLWHVKDALASDAPATVRSADLAWAVQSIVPYAADGTQQGTEMGGDLG